MSEILTNLLPWLNEGHSPYHTVAQAGRYLADRGFTELSLGGDFALAPQGRYFVRNGTFLAAFTVGKNPGFFRIAASHTDWPCFRVKPKSEQVCAGCLKLSVEPYGGAILNSWYDRPLSLAGEVLVKGEDAMAPNKVLVSWDEPLLTIPNLAIHMNREVNKGVTTKPNVDTLPICHTVEKGFEKEGYLLTKLAQKLGVSKEDILSFELYIYCAEQACALGFEQELLSSPRLDNLTSVQACVSALAEAEGHGISVAVLFDNEEIGSNTLRGGDSTTLTLILEKIALALGMDRSSFLNACVNGMLLSCDVAHAIHPNHPEYADLDNGPVLNGGVALKRSPRYSSDAETCGVITGLCRKWDIPLQLYMNRADLPGGSTIGSMASSLLAMPAVDVGIPILAMHSARETMGVKDQSALYRLCKAFFEE